MDEAAKTVAGEASAKKEDSRGQEVLGQG